MKQPPARQPKCWPGCRAISSARAQWWDQFAAPTVGGLRAVSGQETLTAARRVADALSAWHRAGAGSGDLNFWRPYVEEFDSPQAYSWVIEALLERRDLAASMALLMHWLSHADTVRLEEGPHSFHTLAERWLGMALAADCTDAANSERLLRKFFDYLEANADTYWEVPEAGAAEALLRPDGRSTGTEPAEPDEEPGDQADQDVYGAAYDEMVYRDTTDDDVEGSMLEAQHGRDDPELELEANQLVRRLAFLRTVARLWRRVALAEAGQQETISPRIGTLDAWREQAQRNHRRLLALAAYVAAQPLPAASAAQESLMEYDRRATLKESVLERIISACVAMDEAAQLLDAVVATRSPPTAGGSQPTVASADAPLDPAIQLWRSVLGGDVAAVRRGWSAYLAHLRQQPLLYLKLTKGGGPQQIAAARGRQQMIRQLLRRLPRLGMLREACQLIETARLMERDHPLGPGSITEFHQLFEVGFQAMVESVVASAATWPTPAELNPEFSEADDDPCDADLIDALQHVTQSLLSQWSSHSHTLRLSVMERVSSQREWQDLVKFIERYGSELFTQSFFTYGNVHAILHEGIDAWLDQLQADEQTYGDLRLVQDLDGRLSRPDARKHLSLIIEAVVENYAEYRDYNATTTQSDRGEMLHTLLDFLRLKAVYERIHWNLRPVLTVHEVLVRQRARVPLACGPAPWPRKQEPLPISISAGWPNCSANTVCGWPRLPIAWPSGSCGRWPSTGCGRWCRWRRPKLGSERPARRLPHWKRKRANWPRSRPALGSIRRSGWSCSMRK